MSAELTKVDSAVQGLSSSPPKERIHHKKSGSHSYPGVRNINELEAEGTELQIEKDTQKTGWKINTSPTSIDDKDILKKLLTTPPVKKIDLHFPLGLEVTARNMKGVTIKDAMDAIHKQFRKKADDELEAPYLKGFEWDKEESWTRLVVHLQKENTVPAHHGQSKKKKKNAE